MSVSRCRACGSDGVEIFHVQESVPVNSCLLVSSESEAREFPTGRIELGFCSVCGFIGNQAFDHDLTVYAQGYEETQAFSPRFVEFATSLARRWVDTYHLSGKHVVEIGSGKGEFLELMVGAGIGSGLGIDPALDESRLPQGEDSLEWHRGSFDETYGPLVADAVVCRHTLEHIPDVGEFISQLRGAIGDRTDTVVLFEIPDTKRVLEEAAFWDIYYEHCSYFTEGSLARLFEKCGFEIVSLSLAYGDQYLILEAKPAGDGAAVWPADDFGDLAAGIAHFSSSHQSVISTWRERLAEVKARSGNAVIWGASSKGVSFLTLVGDLVTAAVDVNPHKQGTYMAGTGHRILAPGDLEALGVDMVVVMNPVYLDEIRQDLESRGISAEVISL